jgi:hypothetical protein
MLSIGTPEMVTPFVIHISLRSMSRLFDPAGPLLSTPRAVHPLILGTIEEQAGRAPRGSPLQLVFQSPETTSDDPNEMRAMIREYFTFLAEGYCREIRQILHQGWIALFVGLCFLAIAAAIGEVIHATIQGRFLSNVASGLEIFGWVALWRPAELLLYEWMPIYRRRRLMERLAQATVEYH